jgi:hypothetical protein
VKFAAIALSAAAVASPVCAGPISLNPANWFWTTSTEGLNWDAPSGPRRGRNPLNSFGQHGLGLNTNDSVQTGTRLTPGEQYGEFQSLSLTCKDCQDQGSTRISVLGDDGRVLGQQFLPFVGPSVNGQKVNVEIPLFGARTGEEITIDILVSDFNKPGGNGVTISRAYATQNCEVRRANFGTVSTAPIARQERTSRHERREARQERREDRSERGGKGKRK